MPDPTGEVTMRRVSHPRIARAHVPLRPHPGGVALLAAILAVGAFALGAHRALVVLAVPTTFAMPVIAAIADWHSGVPAPRRIAAPLDVLVVVLAALALTLLGEAVVTHVSLTAIVAPSAEATTFPYLVPLGALTYIAYLQLGVVSEGRRRLPRRAGRIAGPCAVAVCFGLACAVYLLLTNWGTVPVGRRHAVGLRPVSGPLPALDVVAWLVAVTGWQAAFNLLDGWPLGRVRRAGPRIVLANVTVLALGTATYVVARSVLGVSPVELEAAAAMFAAGCSITAVTFGGWPVADAPAPWRRGGMLALALALAAVGDIGLRALGLAVDDAWTTVGPVQVWLVVCGLNLIGGGALIAGPILGLGPRRARRRPAGAADHGRTVTR